MKDSTKTYFKTKSKSYAYAIQYITGKYFYKFDGEGEFKNYTIYSFEINENEKEEFYIKLRKLDKIKYDIK